MLSIQPCIRLICFKSLGKLLHSNFIVQLTISQNGDQKYKPHGAGSNPKLKAHNLELKENRISCYDGQSNDPWPTMDVQGLLM